MSGESSNGTGAPGVAAADGSGAAGVASGAPPASEAAPAEEQGPGEGLTDEAPGVGSALLLCLAWLAAAGILVVLLMRRRRGDDPPGGDDPDPFPFVPQHEPEVRQRLRDRVDS